MLLRSRAYPRPWKREIGHEPISTLRPSGIWKGLKRSLESAILCGFAERAMAVGPGPYVLNAIARRSLEGRPMMGAPQPAAPVLPQAPAAPPVFGSTAPGQKPQAKSSQPTFLGSSLAAGGENQGRKSLIGGAGAGAFAS